MKHIKDPLYGYIDVSDFELSIINTEEFQRLRRIKQLGLSSLVYPGATHSRFSHSLGVMYLAKELSKSLELSDEEIKQNSIAGLLHDIGHLPYSHTLESVLNNRADLSHEEISCRYISKLEQKNDIENFNSEFIKNVILGEYNGINIISNEVDVDRMDYLVRDSHNTGIELGKFEIDTIIKFAEIINNKLGFNHKALVSIESLISSREHMSYSVYEHNTVYVAEKMLEKAVKLHLDNTKYQITDFIGLTDDELNYILYNSACEKANKIFKQLQSRKLYKQIHKYPFSKTNLSHNTNRKQLEKNIAEYCNIKPHSIIVKLPKKSKKKNYKTPIKLPNNNIRPLNDVYNLTKTVNTTNIADNMIEIYTPTTQIKHITENVEEYFKTI